MRSARRSEGAGKEPVTRIILVRHGETAWSLEGRYQGWTDTPLTAQGKRQAARLARFFKKKKVDFFYSSCLGRAVETARVIAKPHEKAARPDSRLNEMSFGRWEGKTFKELNRSHDSVYQVWCRGETLTPAGGEPISRFKKRVNAVICELQMKHAGKTVLVVTHGGVIHMALTLALGLSLKNFWLFAVNLASVSILEFGAKYRSVKCVNYVP